MQRQQCKSQKRHGVKKKSDGFTLVELAIVLVIIGLIIGGILFGSALIRTAEIRAVIKEKDQLEAAIFTFIGRYNALPGDMKNANNFFSPDCGDNTDSAATGCNGDGNGIINFSSGFSGGGEHLKIWEHLSLAKLIAGHYDITNRLDGFTIDATNIPASRFPSAFWNFRPFPVEEVAGTNAAENNMLGLGAVTAGVSADGWLDVLPTMANGEAWDIDTKTDDGHANTGAVRGNAHLDCDDVGTDYYKLQAVGADTKGNCTLTWILKL